MTNYCAIDNFKMDGFAIWMLLTLFVFLPATKSQQCSLSGRCTVSDWFFFKIELGWLPAAWFLKGAGIVDQKTVCRENQCQELCFRNSDCRWYLLDSNVRTCFMYDGCPNTIDCSSCLRGEKECYKEGTAPVLMSLVKGVAALSQT